MRSRSGLFCRNRFTAWCFTVICIGASSCGAGAQAQEAAALPSTPVDAATVDAAIDAAREALAAGDAPRATEAYGQAHRALTELWQQALTQKALRRPAQRLRSRLLAVRTTLEKQGGTLPALGVLDPRSSGKRLTAPSFTAEIGPWLCARCGGCHVAKTTAGLSMRSYAALLRGGESGPAIVTGNPSESPLFKRIAAGEMPPEGEPVPPAQLDRLRQWIAAGARFDGEDPEASVLPASFENVSANGEEATATPELTRPSGKETVSFAADIAPVLVENCLECHNDQRASSGLSFERFASLLRGGGSGALWRLGKPDESLLVRKLRGTAANGQRMPRDRPPLDESTIARFATWIAQRAAFDGADVETPTVSIASLAAAARMTVEDRSGRRRELAVRDWRQALPDLPPQRVQRGEFFALGEQSPAQLEAVLREAETIWPEVLQQLGLPAERFAALGERSLLVFEHDADYVEFGRMVERRELLKVGAGHASFDGLRWYGCLRPLAGIDPGDRRAAHAEILCELALATIAGLPEWFVGGSGQAVGALLSPEAPAVQQRERDLDKTLEAHEKPGAFLENGLPPRDTALVAFGFVQQLLRAPRRYARLIEALASGSTLDKALVEHYGAPAPELVEKWLALRRKK